MKRLLLTIGFVAAALALAHGGADLAPYSLADGTALTRLRDFLHRYCDREFERDEPAA